MCTIQSSLIWFAVPSPDLAVVLLWSAQCDLPQGQYIFGYLLTQEHYVPSNLDYENNILNAFFDFCRWWLGSRQLMLVLALSHLTRQTSCDCIGWLQRACVFETLEDIDSEDSDISQPVLMQCDWNAVYFYCQSRVS